MTQKIRRKFFQSTNLEELEKTVNDFTDQYSPGEILDVMFHPVVESMNMDSEESKGITYSPNNPQHPISEKIRGKERQWVTDKFFVMVTYLVEDTKSGLLG